MNKIKFTLFSDHIENCDADAKILSNHDPTIWYLRIGYQIVSKWE